MIWQCQLVQGLHDCQFVQGLHGNASLYKVYMTMPVSTRFAWQCQLVQGLHGNARLYKVYMAMPVCTQYTWQCQFVQGLHSNASLYNVYTAMPVCTRYTWQCQFVHFVQGLHRNAHVILQIVPAQQGTCFVSSMNGDTKKVSLQVLDNHQDASTCNPHSYLPPPPPPTLVLWKWTAREIIHFCWSTQAQSCVQSYHCTMNVWQLVKIMWLQNGMRTFQSCPSIRETQWNLQ